MAVIGNAPFQGLVSGGNIIDASIEGVDLSTSAIAARLGYTPVDPGAAAIIGGTINGTTIGATTAASGSFTTVSASGAVTLNGLTASTALALDASKNLVSVTNTGSGNNVLATSPTLVTPVLGTPTSGNFSTGTFTWPTFNQNTTGTAAGLSATLATASGGTGLTTFTSGGLVYASSTSALTTGSALTFDGTNFTTTKAGTVEGYATNTATTGQAGWWSQNNSSVKSGVFQYGSAQGPYGAIGAGEGAFYSNGSLTIMSDSGSGIIKFAAGGNTERLRITSTGQLSLAYAGFQIQSPAGSLSFPQGASLQTGGFGRAWNPAQQIGQGSNAGLYGMAHTYLAYYDAGWKSLGGGTASAITIDEGNFSFSNTNGVSATNSALSWTTRMFINTSGNIGMGTVSPATRLEIREDTSSRNTVTNMLTLHNYSATNPYDGFGNGIVFKGLDYSNAPQTYASIVGGIYATNRSTPQPDTGFAGILKFLTGTNGANAERMSISSTQMLVNVPVGIGTGTPSQFSTRFSIVGTGSADEIVLSATSGYSGGWTNSRLRLGAYGSNGYLGADIFATSNYNSTTGTSLSFATSPIGVAATTTPIERMRITPDGTIQKYGTNGNMYIMDGNTAGGVKIAAYTANFTSNGYLAFEGYSYEYARFNATGNFGIGTIDPGDKLEVQGNIRLDGPAGTNRDIYFRNMGSGAGGSIKSDKALSFYAGSGAGSPTLYMTIKEGGNIGIGQTLPTAKLHIGSETDPNITNQALFVQGSKSQYAGINGLTMGSLFVYDDTAGTVGSGGAISFGANTGSSQRTWIAAIESRRDSATTDASNYGGSLVFYTRPAQSPSEERMRITSSGDCTFVTPTAAVRVNNGTTAQRPTPAAGAMRWNTTLAQLEVADGTSFEKVLVDTVVTSATGGSVIEDGDYKVHTFTSSGTFTLTSVSGGNKADLQVLVVGGGGGGGFYLGGGGGGGAMLEKIISVAAGTYTVTVGAGGSSINSGYTYSTNGGASSVTGGTLGATEVYVFGGGAGSNGAANDAWGANGYAQGVGCGGGGASPYGFSAANHMVHACAGGSAGRNGSGGGAGSMYSSLTFTGGGGGGGALSAGITPVVGNGPVGVGGWGGSGMTSTISGSSAAYGGGGGGGYGTYNANGGISGGSGGGGYGVGSANSGGNLQAAAGTTNTGGGGGGGQYYSGYQQGGAGGSGIVIIRYKFR